MNHWQRRLVALRARRAALGPPIELPREELEIAPPAPRYGLPAPPVPLDPLAPIPVPDHVVHGVHRTCGRCQSYLTSEARYCLRCTKPEELHAATHAPIVRDLDPSYDFPQPRRSDER